MKKHHNYSLLGLLVLATFIGGLFLLTTGGTDVVQQQASYVVYLPIIANQTRFYAWVNPPWKQTKFAPQYLWWCDARQDRQLVDTATQAISCAQNNEGLLYIFKDEQDLFTTPALYAQSYHDFVLAVQAVDPAARFSPAGISQGSGTAWAQQFYDAYVGLYGTPPPVNEWRFHAFCWGDSNTWKALVQGYIDWTNAKGGKLFLGSIGFPFYAEDVLTNEELMLDFIVSQPTIVGAVWWSYDFVEWPHRLVDANGNLTPEGMLYSEYR